MCIRDRGQADEHELDMAYEQIDDFLEGREIDPAYAAELQDRYRRTAHKRTVPVGPDDTWWRAT
jgi:NAD+ synthase